MESDEIRTKYEQFILKPVIHDLAIEKGKGLMLLDSAGREYLDFTAGFGVSLLGHNNEYTGYIIEAMYKQMKRLIHSSHYMYYSEPVSALAERLAQISPRGLAKTFFCNSGTEAVEGAIRTIRKNKRKYELLALQQGFMGRTLGSVSLTGHSENKRDIGPLLPGVYHLPAPYCYRCSLKHKYPECGIACAEYVEDFIEYGTTGSIAALFFETIMGDSGVVVPPEEYFHRITAICKRKDIAIVVDETLTGFGITGKLFASEHWGLEPDIMILGKALGGGLPLGAFIVRQEVAETFEYKDFSSTLGGNPVACAAGLAMIDLVEKENLIEKAEKQGQYLIKEIEAVKRTFNIIGDVRGKGLLIGIEIVEPETQNPAPGRASQVQDLLRENGILLTTYGKSTFRLSPPLIIQREHIDRFTETLSSVLKKISLS